MKRAPLSEHTSQSRIAKTAPSYNVLLAGESGVGSFRFSDERIMERIICRLY